MTYEPISESYDSNIYSDAKRNRDRRARELRRLGYLVQIDLKDGIYSLYAKHE